MTHDPSNAETWLPNNTARQLAERCGVDPSSVDDAAGLLALNRAPKDARTVLVQAGATDNCAHEIVRQLRELRDHPVHPAIG